MPEDATVAPVDPARTALLLLDFQNAAVSLVSQAVEDGLLNRVAQVRAAAHDAGVQVVYVRVGLTDADYRAIGQFNKVFAPYAQARYLGEGDPSAKIHAEILPEEGDLVVTKKRFGAFSTSNLDLLLNPREFDNLVLCGISTSGVVLSTLREAADRDYRILVISDCCVDPDPELHDLLLERYFPVQADVVTADVFANLLAAQR